MSPNAPDDRSRTLLVGISNPATASRLVALAARIVAQRPWTVLLTHVVTVADQISLTTGRSSPEVVRARDFLQAVKSEAAGAGLAARALVEVARSVDEGLLSAAQSRDAALVLVGYSEADETDAGGEVGEERFDRTMHQVARKAEADVVVAKFRTGTMSRILVPIADGAPLELTALLCRALAADTAGAVTFMHVAGPEPESARPRLARQLEDAGLASLGRLDVVGGTDPLDAVTKAAEDYDLMVVGPSQRPGLMSAIFSTRAQRLAEESPASVLLAWSG